MMFQPALVLLSAALAIASPINPRAGGPSTGPIPANCTVTNTLPPNSSADSDTTSISGWMLSPDFSSAHQIYEAYYDNPQDGGQSCVNQCHGMEGCQSALFAHNIMTPDGYYGTSPHLSPEGCLLFDAAAGPEVFVVAPQGQYLNETGANVKCPS